MTMSVNILGPAALVLLSVASCGSSQTPGLDQNDRIARVLSHLHVRASIDSVPEERWTLEERMAHHRVPAVSIAVVHDGAIQWARAYGSKLAGKDQGVSDTTLFQAASISKQLTAFATLRVVDEGRLSLDAPVNRYLRSWKLPDSDAGASDSVTVALLLGHMAGLNVPGFPGYKAGDAIPTLTQILDGVAPASTPPVRIEQRPGSRWSYSGGGYVVLQQVLQDVTGQSFARLMDSLVLVPLGMDHSTFQQPSPADLAASAAVGHRDDGEPLAERWRVQPELAAAGLWTTPSDLARFALGVRAAATGSPQSLLSAQSAEALTTPRFFNFSLGLLIRRNGPDAWFTYNGGNYGYRALMYQYLTTGEGAVVMTNGENGMDLAREVINAIALVYDWPGFVPEELQ